jgi:HK97 family phage prohead protease
MDYTFWTRTASGSFTRTKAAPIVPDFECHADITLRLANGEKGLKATDDKGQMPIRILSSTADVDSHEEIVERSAFASSLEAYNALPILLAYHDMKQPVGLAPARMTKDGLLHPSAFISAGRPDIQELVRDGVLTKASIGFMVKDAVWDDELELVRITDLELLEVSLVPVPANRHTFVEAAKGWSETFGRAAATPRELAENPQEEPERVPALPMQELSGAVMAFADSLRG